jgi:hypothetical protein
LGEGHAGAEGIVPWLGFFPCKPLVTKVEQPVKQMATPVSDKPPRPTSPLSEASNNKEPESDDPTSKPVSSRMASWQQRVNSSVPAKEEEPTAYSVNARMSAWETMSMFEALPSFAV